MISESGIPSSSPERANRLFPAVSQDLNVLVVDDLESNLIALEASLRDANYNLVMAQSGEQAIQFVVETDFAVILLDVQMPVMNGLETARRIRTIERARRTPIIFLTAHHPGRDFVLQGYEVGCVDYLFKPLNIEILRAKVDVFVDLCRKNQEIERQAKLLLKVEALREAVRVRDEFLSIASHELRTPITPLQLQMEGFLYMLEKGKLDSVPVAELAHMLEISNAQVGRLSRLISQLLDVSRLNASRLGLEYSTFDFSQLIHDILKQLHYEIRISNCSIKTDIERGVTGEWDRLRIEQVVINLLTNSLKYGVGKPIEISLTSSAHFITLQVRDFGIGIAAKDHKRIFEQFERAVSVKHFGGLGLGLFITKQFIEMHGGGIEVESELNQGANFIVVLPRKRGAHEEYPCH